MKTTISSILVNNAVEYANQAKKAAERVNPQEEVRKSIGAHLMMALAIEGIGNEVGKAGLPTSLWDRIEKSDTVVKWYIISGIGGHQHFQLDKEPLQTIQRLVTIRNRIAHPKVEDLGDEVIIKTKRGVLRLAHPQSEQQGLDGDKKSNKGTLIRNVPPSYVLQDGDAIYIGLGKLIDEFSSANAVMTIEKGIAAILTLRKHLAISGLDWINDFEKKADK